jgi:hypothetical protein
MKSPKTSRKQEPLQEQAPEVEYVLDMPRLFRDVADYSSPDFSLLFVIMFVAIAYFHETHFTYTTVAIAAWLLLQTVASVTRTDFKTDLFWNITSLLGNLLFYLFLGYLWSLVKVISLQKFLCVTNHLLR